MQPKRSAQVGLAASLDFWYAPYRDLVTSLAVIAALGGVLAYAENFALAAMARALTAPEAAPVEGLRQWSGVGIPAAAFSLGFFVLFRFVSAFSATWQERRQGALELRVLCDLEQFLLSNLLRKNDHFFAERSHGEILNRFGGDIKRVSASRGLVLQQCRSAFLVAGNLYFFASQNWRLAALAVVTLAAGALVADRLIRGVQAMDRTYLSTDDHVKASFEDLLGAGPEVQVGNLFARVAAAFARVQEPRTRLFHRYVKLESLVGMTPAIGYGCALATLMLFALYSLSGGSAASAAAMVPVILKALPELFGNAASLVTQRLVLHRANSSARRLMDYESFDGRHGEDAQPTVVPPASSLQLDAVTYRYTAGNGSLQGGIADVSAELALGKWTAIVGAAGSGKSTLLQLVLGRNHPQSGKVRYGAHDLHELSDASRASVLALMPQKYFALDTTIEENLTFADARSADDALTQDDLELVEQLGLGDVCRYRALEMMPKPEHLRGETAGAIVALRTRVRERLATEGVDVRPYERGSVDPLHWTLELLVSGKCDRPRVLERLQRGATRAQLFRGLSPRWREELLLRGRSTLREQVHLLTLPTYESYEQLADRPLPEPVWQLRRASAELLGRGESVDDDLVLVGLTTSLAELGIKPAEREAAVAAWRSAFAADVANLQRVCGDALISFDVTRINHYLSWRENLVFGFADATNQRAAQRSDQLVLGLVEAAGLREHLTRVGLGYHVGRNGSRLSGGQRQLVALCRAMLRRTPVLVLDEPTSALDPASRARVSKVLTANRDGRVIVTVSHDRELVRDADHVLFMVHGRLAASGTFEELKATSEEFRRTLRA